MYPINIITILFVIATLFSCNNEPKNNNANLSKGTNTSQQVKNKTPNKVSTSTKNKYWVAVQKELNLTNAQLNQVSNVIAKYQGQIASLRKKGNTSSIKSMQAKQQKELIAIMGHKKFYQKVKFDKNRR